MTTPRRFQSHPYHLVQPSYWPLGVSVSLGTVLFGTAMWLHSYAFGAETLAVGLIALLTIVTLWFRDVIHEALLGYHTRIVQKGLMLGIGWFIFSEVMFFFGFFWAFFHSSLAPTPEIGCAWPPAGIHVFDPFEIPLLNTMILLLSGASVTWAHHAVAHGKRGEATAGFIVTLLLAASFTALQGLEYVEAAFTISDSIYGATFYMMTGFHGLHVLVGTIGIAICFIRHLRRHFLPTHHVGFLAAIWYWHFVDVVWLFLYVFIYIWGGWVPTV